MTDPLAALRDRFRARAAADRLTLELLSHGDLHSDELRSLVHKLAGAAGTFGYALLSKAAAEIDDQMTSGKAADLESLRLLKEQLDRLLKQYL